jgi:hypothetical protein
LRELYEVTEDIDVGRLQLLRRTDTDGDGRIAPIDLRLYSWCGNIYAGLKWRKSGTGCDVVKDSGWSAFVDDGSWGAMEIIETNEDMEARIRALIIVDTRDIIGMQSGCESGSLV